MALGSSSSATSSTGTQITTSITTSALYELACQYKICYNNALYKDAGNEHFRENRARKAKKSYHFALLQTRAISSRDTVGRSMSFLKSSVEDSNLAHEVDPSDTTFKADVERIEADCNRNLALIFVNEKQWCKAEVYSQKVLEYDEFDEKALYRFSLALLQQKDGVKCEEPIQRLLELSPDSVMYNNLDKHRTALLSKQRDTEKQLYRKMLG